MDEEKLAEDLAATYWVSCAGKTDPTALNKHWIKVARHVLKLLRIQKLWGRIIGIQECDTDESFLYDEARQRRITKIQQELKEERGVHKTI